MIALSFAFHYSPHTSYACSCAEPLPVNEEMERSAAVFSGKTVDMFDKNENSSTLSSADPIAVKFEVEESWKGVNQSQVIVYTVRESASCGFEFELDQQYLVYAQERDGELDVSLCSRTTHLSNAQEDIDELGQGDKPTEQVSIDLEDEGSTQYQSASIVVFIAVLILVGAYMTRRKRQTQE
nr:hypothetical protein [Caldalkalibacillus salinus]